MLKFEQNIPFKNFVEFCQNHIIEYEKVLYRWVGVDYKIQSIIIDMVTQGMEDKRDLKEPGVKNGSKIEILV